MAKDILKMLDASTKIRKDVSIIILNIENNDMIEFLTTLENEIENNRILQLAKGENRISFICDDPLALRLSKENKQKVLSYKKELAAITCPEASIILIDDLKFFSRAKTYAPAKSCANELKNLTSLPLKP